MKKYLGIALFTIVCVLGVNSSVFADQTYDDLSAQIDQMNKDLQSNVNYTQNLKRSTEDYLKQRRIVVDDLTAQLTAVKGELYKTQQELAETKAELVKLNGGVALPVVAHSSAPAVVAGTAAGTVANSGTAGAPVVGAVAATNSQPGNIMLDNTKPVSTVATPIGAPVVGSAAGNTGGVAVGTAVAGTAAVVGTPALLLIPTKPEGITIGEIKAAVDNNKNADVKTMVATFNADKKNSAKDKSTAAFWLGAVYTKESDFKNSSIAFTDSFKFDPKNARSGMTIYNLGKSLEKLDKKDSACNAYFQILNKQVKGADKAKDVSLKSAQDLKCDGIEKFAKPVATAKKPAESTKNKSKSVKK